MEPQDQIERWGFFTIGIYTLMGVITAVLGAPAVAYLFFPPKVKHEAEWVSVGDFAQLPVDTPEEVVFQRNRVDGWKISSEKVPRVVTLRLQVYEELVALTGIEPVFKP